MKRVMLGVPGALVGAAAGGIALGALAVVAATQYFTAADGTSRDAAC